MLPCIILNSLYSEYNTIDKKGVIYRFDQICSFPPGFIFFDYATGKFYKLVFKFLFKDACNP